MKKFVFILALMVPMALLAQSDSEKKLTKFEQFTSKTGRISKFVDVKMPNILLNYLGGALETSIRTLMGEQSNSYFYRIEEAETSSHVGHIAMIEYSDLTEINKALTRLASEVEADCATKPDYLENRFITEDGFHIGYFVSKGKATWYLKLERYSSSTVFIRNAEDLTKNFSEAQKKIEELKQSNGK